MKSLVHFCKALAGLDQPGTQVTPQELSVILQYAQGAANVVEIGCYEGATAAALALSTPGQIYSIDIFDSDWAGLCYRYWIARTHIRRKGIGNIRLIKAFSHEAAKRLSVEIDFLFIDGDHTREGIERDWTGWFPKVKVGGVIALHDCKIAENSPVELGSGHFYREHLSKLDYLAEMESIDSLVVFRKLR